MAKLIVSSIFFISLKDTRHFFSIATVISSLNVQQSPQHLLIKPDQREVKLSCRHGDSSYQYMYWYQQKGVGESIELIGMLQYQRDTIEEKFKPRFNISGHATGDAFLIISNPTPEDSAVYFCAASSTATHFPFLLNKKLHTKHLQIRSVL
ncbi:hypothetical protein QTP70_017885 [Hemibagrus guttatus]|uniref:Ig-like domain-containing protein n=1 Tax=Hemibagrus guttatus TaxID=175788 RepID=A0AAE0QZ64_9TELE|nr:hypothetical protein QTP70_017885 [Hemibagrus guttatus]